MSMGRNVHGSKCPWVEMSMGRNVLGRTVRGRNVRGRNVRGPKCPFTMTINLDVRPFHILSRGWSGGGWVEGVSVGGGGWAGRWWAGGGGGSGVEDIMKVGSLVHFC